MYGAMTHGSLMPGIGTLLLEFDAAGTFAAGDWVKFDGTTGELVVATAGDTLLGVSKEAATAASEDVSVVCPPFLKVTMDNDNDSTTFAATHVGEYADITGATEEQLVDSDSHSTTVAQLCCLEYNPQGLGFDSDTSIGSYMAQQMHFTITPTS